MGWMSERDTNLGPLNILSDILPTKLYMAPVIEPV